MYAYFPAAVTILKHIVTTTHYVSRGADESFIYPQEHG